MTDAPTGLADARSNVPGVRWPPIFHGVLASLQALTSTLEDTQWLPVETIAALQRDQLGVLLHHAARQSSQFRGRLDRAGLRVEDLLVEGGLRRLPVLGRRDIQRAGPELFCRDLPGGHKPVGETRTSGSTGEPVVVRRTALNQLFWNALNLRFLLWQRIDFGSRCAAIRGPISVYQVKDDWGPPMSQMFRTGRQLAIPMTTDIVQQATWLREFEPYFLNIYPTNLDALTRHCRKHGLGIPGLKRIFTIGETLSPRVRREAGEVFAAKVDDLYSSQELGVIAAQCPQSGLYHVMAESLIVEVLDDKGEPCREGEVGRITATDLHNFATPLVRYDIGDYAEVAGPCPCGRGLPSLKQVLGRERNMVIRPDGVRHWPLVGFARFRDVAPISQYQLVQHHLDRVEVRLVAEKALTQAQEGELTAIIQQALGYPFVLAFSYFDGEIPSAPGRKFEEFVCAVPSQELARIGFAPAGP